jgi:chemotaxis protein methyltransferase CheR
LNFSPTRARGQSQIQRVAIRDDDCVALLQWACPRLGLRWEGFRRVRGQVCKRIGRRLGELGLGAREYRKRLEADPGEWRRLEEACRVTISRFHRDRAVWEILRTRVLPGLASRAVAEGRALRCWSAGCASGEEPYTLAMILERLGVAGLHFEVLATDADARVLERAHRGCYARATLNELPSEWLPEAFREEGPEWCVLPAVRAHVRFEQQDLRRALPDGLSDVLLCRNLAFTYFGREAQEELARTLVARISAGGVLVIGVHERPQVELPLDRLNPLPIFQKV